jgi:nucleotide-binding universal stress UspA family protein
MYERILVPVDGSNVAALGLERAIETARLTGGRIRVLHVLDELVFATGFEPGVTYERDVLPRMRRRGETLLADACARVIEAGVPVDSVLMECFARRTSDVILDAAQAWRADLIVIGTHGRRGASRWFLGSDAEEVLRGAKAPVLLVRGSDVAKATTEAANVAEVA